MKKSIHEFRSILTETEKLSTLQLCQLKGGDGGEDLRRNTSASATTTTTTTTTTVTAKI